MPEVPSTNAFDIQPTREERTRVFLGDHLHAEEKEGAFELASIFHNPDREMSHTAVLIPVAAHQDSDLVLHTMGEYNRQRGSENFSIFLLFNAPPDSNFADVAKQETERAMASFPSLDIRAAYAEYPEFSIGAVRRDLWNGVITLAYYRGLLAPGMPDVIGINHDIDTAAISPHYIKRVQQYYKTRQRNATSVGAPEAPLKPAGTRVSHAVLPSHPNIGKVTKWIDNTYFQHPNQGSYEAGIVIPFSYYTLLGGFDPDHKTHETRWVAGGGPLKEITGAQLFTSPRRYIDRAEEHGSTGIWLPGSFGTDDSCRGQLKPDISTETAEDLILERLDSDMSESWMYNALSGVYKEIKDAPLSDLQSAMFKDEMTVRAEVAANKQLAKAARFLRKVVGSHVLADILESSYDATKFAREQVEQLTLFNKAWYELDANTSEATELV